MRSTRRSATISGALLALTLALSITSGAHAAPPDKTACASSYEQAQRLRRDRKLVKARDALLVCLNDACPTILRTDCTTWLGEVDASLPSVVFEARGADGANLADVTVSSGDEVLAARLDGKAMPIDPGERALRFEHAGAKPIEQTFVVREGEKLQKIAVVFPDVGVPPPSTITPPPKPSPDVTATPNPAPTLLTPPSHDEGRADLRSRAPIPWTAWALGGVGVVGLGVFGAFAISGSSDVSNTLDPCKPSCPHSDVQAVRTKYLVADIGLAVGVLALGAAAWIYFFGRDAR